MPVEVVDYRAEWPAEFERVAADLADALRTVAVLAIEHVGSTSVEGLCAKPILDIDVVVEAAQVPPTIAALEAVGYVHRGDLGVAHREAFLAPEGDPARNVYVCTSGTLNLRNHLAVRDVLRRRRDLRDAYGAIKRSLASDPEMDIDAYVARKSGVLQEVLAVAQFSEDERLAILRLNDPSV